MDGMDPIELNLFSSRVSAICDEMGLVLKRAAFSPNIKDRLDYSCAIFDTNGQMLAQADHMPVHLGSMAYAMQSIVKDKDWMPGDLLILNDPFLGGTHLPDVTAISPVFSGSGRLGGFVVNRAHHANIGCSTPGSMPISSTLEEEGLIIPPIFLFRAGVLQEDVTQLLGVANNSLAGDFAAQVGANKIGGIRLEQLIEKMGWTTYLQNIEQLNNFAERISSATISRLKSGTYKFVDYLDDDGYGTINIKIAVKMVIASDKVKLDFTDSSIMVKGNLNCPEAVLAAASYYCFRCMMPPYTPACHGLFRNIEIKTREGSILNAKRPAAVAAGNVETSMRAVDVIFGALSKASPELVPSAAQGTMNNIAMGLIDEDKGTRWDYYETIAGGTGGGPTFRGLDGKHSHMTNTLNTPVESLEMHYPLRISRYELRRRSGGNGKNRGGNGIIREYEFLDGAYVTILSERRTTGPWGLEGGLSGDTGVNLFNYSPVPSKCSLKARKGDKLTILTPGGGGWGSIS